jgi:hypothetical protein
VTRNALSYEYVAPHDVIFFKQPVHEQTSALLQHSVYIRGSPIDANQSLVMATIVLLHRCSICGLEQKVGLGDNGRHVATKGPLTYKYAG